MKVYAETNWLLDLALEQERIQSSLFVIELAKDKKVHLCLPEISLIEANQKIVRRRLQREDLEHNLRQERRELMRSRDARYQSQAAAIDQDILRLIEISEFDVMVKNMSKAGLFLLFSFCLLTRLVIIPLFPDEGDHCIRG